MTAPLRPTAPPPADQLRADALALLDDFRARSLPACLRRMNLWSGLHDRDHADVVDDLVQDLALDCVQNAAAIVALPPRERTRRWLRLCERSHYGCRLRAQRRGGPELDADLAPRVPPPTALELGLSDVDRARLRRIATHAELLDNGRLCVRDTARDAKVSRDVLRRLWSDVARALGLDHDHLEFWRRRLAEALCMVAAARLRADGALRVWNDDARRAFDAAAFRTRLGRIRDALLAQPIDPDVRRAVQLAAARGVRVETLTPRALLEMADAIGADLPFVPLWRFELEVDTDAGGDLRTAARCLWRARRLEPDSVRIVLARARLLEARGRVEPARALLRRALARRPAGEPRLAASLQALGDAAGHATARRFAKSARAPSRDPAHGSAARGAEAAAAGRLDADPRAGRQHA